MRIALTQGYTSLVDKEDYIRVKCYKWFASVCYRKDKGIYTVYAMRSLPREGKVQKRQLLHRFVLNIMRSDVEIDHINGNGLDNRRANLRCSTHSENMRNRGKNTNNTSGFKGVHWHKASSSWVAEITVNYRRVHLGYFSDVKAAAKAYDKATIKYHGAFAVPNKKEIK